MDEFLNEMRAFEDSRFVALLQEITPAHFQDILAAIGLVMDEMEYAKKDIDRILNSMISRGDYSRAQDLLETSRALHQISEKARTFIDRNRAEESEISEDDLLEQMEFGPSAQVDYDSYRVDESIAHDLFSPVTYRRPAAFSYKGHKYNVTTWKQMLVMICEILYRENKELFISFANDKSMRGRKRPLFSKDKTKLTNRASPVLNSGVYVETNLSANSIREVILAMLKKYNISSDAVNFFISKDLSGLHQ